LALPAYQPHQATALYWIVGSVATLLFFASLLAHEVSHAVVAKHYGIGVRRITFWLFGGVSELEGDALSPGVDFASPWSGRSRAWRSPLSSVWSPCPLANRA